MHPGKYSDKSKEINVTVLFSLCLNSPRSDATTRYKVTPVDVDTLRLVRRERGEKNALVRYYNAGDVEALKQRLKQDPSSPKKTGEKILAETEFGQTLTSAPSLPGISKAKMKEESLSRAKNKGKSPAKQNEDVSESIEKAPSSSKPKKSPVKKNYDGPGEFCVCDLRACVHLRFMYNHLRSYQYIYDIITACHYL
ncbi:hypothetical protein ARMGADRAFT_1038577 [Armillaria gallica]|uniref:Uncharacterized protein n=1 Tax=Armillaria gallica TaxID=47427 RepID=A0A2H3CTQ0_ARMGA|nr:hypothetical protein ARMGADRAFT_1038577 [Armillaria gallica]